MGGRLQGKVALVTGGASGIGEATARLFAQEGAQVVLADINETAGAALAKTLGMHFIATDVSSEEQVERAVKYTLERHGRIDCMINNAGVVGAVGSIMETTAQAWRATQAVLLDSVFFGIKHAARAMREQRSGVILSLSSIAGVMGGLGPHAYTAAKHGVVGLTRSAASELSAYGIRVNAVAPGTTVTPMIEQVRGGKEAAMTGAAQVSPLGTALLPDEIAAALLFLASDAAAHVTAHTLVVDSGVTAGGFASGASVLRDRPVAFMGPSGEQ
ncbi:MAG TPA: SDR family oxidoreductase [Noviherbaspirillum sp.]|uniref:SDR family oxidoreductase n=1 Tax=Noviherbaspirillum sp. TaxID=1926288 RepID=UPI002B470411|nr:SDR family oxidoreductase [Noviherbaspirillum sp.]HJV84571.1 SDR family oxidoreductase [Noviherbaspirillum sp.]